MPFLSIRTQLLIFSLFSIGLCFAQVDKQKQQFLKQNITPINTLVEKKVVGYVSKYAVNEYLSLYAEQSQFLIYADLNKHTSNCIRLTDSLLYALIFTPEQVKEIEEAIELNKQALMLDKQPGHEATQLFAFAYYQEHLYLLYSVTNFYGMKKQDIIVKRNGSSPSFHSKYLVELNINNGLISRGRMQRFDSDLDVGFHFNIVDDVPALFFKSKVGEKDLYEYFKLPGEWKKQVSEQAFPDMISGFLAENSMYNQYTLRHHINLLIDNKLRKRMKIANGTKNTGGVSTTSMVINERMIYAVVYNHSEKTMSVYKVDMENNKSNMLNSYKLEKEYNMYGIKHLYLDKAEKTLYVMTINLDKQLVLLDAIRI